MTSLRTLLIASAALALTAVSAQAAPAGAYKLAVGATTCAVTLADDGSANFTPDCAQAGHVARWEAKYNGVELKTARGETVALLKGKDGSYSGTRFEDGRSLTLSAEGSAVAQVH
jgi:hypothetical protein